MFYFNFFKRKGISPAIASLDKLDIYLVHCLEAERRLQAAQNQLGANADQNAQQQANIKKHFPSQLLRRLYHFLFCYLIPF